MYTDVFKKRGLSLLICLALVLMPGCQLLEKSSGNPSWDRVLQSVKGTSVDLVLWERDSAAIEWFNTSVKKHLLERYEVVLNVTTVDKNEFLSEIRRAKKELETIGEEDLVWLSPESFAQLKSEGLLYGPFAQNVLNATAFFDPKGLDTQYFDATPIDGLALPFTQQQLSFYYNEDMNYEPPTDLAQLEMAVQDAPGTFTYPQPEDPVGRAFIHSVILTYTSPKAFLEKPLSDEALKALVKPGLEYLRAISKYTYQSGAVYPKDAQALSDLFAESQVFMVMSMDYRHANQLTGDAIYPGGTRPFFLGTTGVGPKEYLSIPYYSDNKSGAMVVMHGLLDLEVQAQKLASKNFQGLPVYDYSMLNSTSMNAIKKALSKKTIPDTVKILEQRQHDIPMQYHAKIAALWRQMVLQP